MTKLTTIGHAALVALVLGASAANAVPVKAQGFGFGLDWSLTNSDRPRRGVPQLCILSDHGIREAVRQQGYTNIYLNVQMGHYIQVRATQGKWVYLLDVNACTGTIMDRQRLRRAS